ncbi:hypothetical protein CHUAL_003593 [Chamberlinius hualienensis]
MELQKGHLFFNRELYIIILILIYNVQSTLALECCDFETSSCSNKWTPVNGKVQWTWTENNAKLPADADASYYINESNNYWLQDTTISDGSSESFTILASYKLNENDVIKFRLYAHTKLNTPNQLSIEIKSPVEEIITLFSADQSGWKDYSFKCTKGNCCATYPCTPQILVVGQILDPSDLLAFDNFGINECLNLGSDVKVRNENDQIYFGQ